MNPTLKQETSVFANRNTPKNMQLLDKIHTVFTAALIFRFYVHEGLYVVGQ